MAKTTEEKKLTLPPGHPERAYHSPLRSEDVDAGVLPDEEQDQVDEFRATLEEEYQAAIDHEDRVARREASQGAEKPAAKSTVKSETT